MPTQSALDVTLEPAYTGLREDLNFQEFREMVDITLMAQNQPGLENLKHVNWQMPQISSTLC